MPRYTSYCSSLRSKPLSFMPWLDAQCLGFWITQGICKCILLVRKLKQTFVVQKGILCWSLGFLTMYIFLSFIFLGTRLVCSLAYSGRQNHKFSSDQESGNAVYHFWVLYFNFDPRLSTVLSLPLQNGFHSSTVTASLAWIKDERSVS